MNAAFGGALPIIVPLAAIAVLLQMIALRPGKAVVSMSRLVKDMVSASAQIASNVLASLVASKCFAVMVAGQG